MGEEGEVWSPVSISSSLLSYISASLHNNRGRNEGRREREGGRGVIGKRVERVGGKRKGEGGREGRTLSLAANFSEASLANFSSLSFCLCASSSSPSRYTLLQTCTA